MTVYDLNRDQLQQLKQQYWIERNDEEPDYYTLANIDDYVSDDEIYDWWGDTEFVPEDFANETDLGYSEFGWTGKANDINILIRDLNRIIDTFYERVRTDENYAKLYGYMAKANNELVMARLLAQDIEWNK